MTPATATEAWVCDFVLRLNLCPFAHRPVAEGRVRYTELAATEVEEAFRMAGARVLAFVAEAAEGVSTELLIFPVVLTDFGEFLDFVATLEEFLTDTGAAALLQLAHFHPDYHFAGVPEDDPANSTNRSPFPTIQLLRVGEVAEATDRHPDPEGIPERNVALLRGGAASL